MPDTRTNEHMSDRELLLLTLATVQRIESKQEALIRALAEEEEEDPPARTLDGVPMPRERDQTQSLG